MPEHSKASPQFYILQECSILLPHKTTKSILIEAKVESSKKDFSHNESYIKNEGLDTK